MKAWQSIIKRLCIDCAEYEVFFILYGTFPIRKTTLTKTMVHILADYAMTIQPQILSRRSTDGGAEALRAAPTICTYGWAFIQNAYPSKDS
jgi:hypothetical protein